MDTKDVGIVPIKSNHFECVSGQNVAEMEQYILYAQSGKGEPMSVLIKDMEMPETCDDCPFHVYHSHYEYVCKATPLFYPMNLANSKGIRKDWCPLVEIEENE